MKGSWWQRSWSPVVAVLVVALCWLWGLGDYGLASYSELPQVLRAQAWLQGKDGGGAWTPGELVRAGALALGADELNFAANTPPGDWLHGILRLPGVLCALALMGLAWAWGRLRGVSPLGLCLVAAALPVTATAARHLAPELWAELAFSALMWSRRAGTRPKGVPNDAGTRPKGFPNDTRPNDTRPNDTRPKGFPNDTRPKGFPKNDTRPKGFPNDTRPMNDTRPKGFPTTRAMQALGLAALGLLLVSAGLGWGWSVAFALLWLDESKSRWGWAALACAAGSLILAATMGAEYSPLLAAARDPQTLLEGLPRLFSTGVMGLLSDYGLWSPVLAFSLLHADKALATERRWVLLIALSQLASASHFEAGPVIGVIPVATLIVSSASALRGPQAWKARRQLGLFMLVGSALLLRSVPHYADQLLWAHHVAPEFAAHAGAQLQELLGVWRFEASLLFAMLFAAGFAGLRDRIWVLALLLMIGYRSQIGSPALAKQSSVRGTAILAQERFGDNTPAIASHGIEDPGWTFYAPPSWPRLATQKEVLEHLTNSPSAGLVLSQASELNLSGDLARMPSPLRVQDAGHPKMRVFNHQSTEGPPYSPQLALLDDLPDLQNQCKIVFANSLELVGWSLTEPLVRGSQAEFLAVFRVLKPLRGPRVLVPRISARPFSPWPDYGTPFLENRFPISQWREGDLVQVTQRFEVPRIMAAGGTQELSLGLARSRYRYDKITEPSQDLPPQSQLRWMGKRRTRIVLGEVEVH